VFCGACGVREILGFLRMWRFRLGLFVEMCLICYIFVFYLSAAVILFTTVTYSLIDSFPITEVQLRILGATIYFFFFFFPNFLFK
jgi:hypothetical protein